MCRERGNIKMRYIFPLLKKTNNLDVLRQIQVSDRFINEVLQEQSWALFIWPG